MTAAQPLDTAASQTKDHIVHMIDSIAFSSAIDGAPANLHIHWYEVEGGTYSLERVHQYDLHRPKDVQEVQIHTRNTVVGYWRAAGNYQDGLWMFILEDELEKKAEAVDERASPLNARC